MKRIGVAILTTGIFITIGLFVFSHLRLYTKTTLSLPSPTLTPTPPPKTITYNGETYAYDIILTYPKDISLIANFTQKTSVQSIIESSQCVAGVNGGFYDTQNKPLGYFLTDSYTHNVIQSALFNGYFVISSDNNASVASSLSLGTRRVGLQSGPLLFTDSRKQPLRIQNDEHARRIVAAVTSDDAVLFIVLYESESSFNGPFLADLPSFIDALNTKESLRIVDALNLDGGSASAFYSANTRLSEITPAGSVFCIKNVVQ